MYPLQALPDRVPLGGRRLEPDARGQGGLRREARAAPGDWVFSRIEFWARLGSRFPIITNFLLSRRSSRWLLERMLGRFAAPAAAQGRANAVHAAGRAAGLDKPRPHLPGPRVVYFVDVYANYYDQELAESVVGVLRHAEVNVFVPSRQRSSGMAALIVGDVDHAREAALANLRVLANAVRDGYTVVCSEPTAALMLRQEYVKLTEDLDAELVAANTMDVGQYLLGLERAGPASAPARAARRPRRLSSALPSASDRRRHAGARAAAKRSLARRRVHQPRLLGNGGNLRALPRSLLDVAPRRPRADEAAARRRHRDRCHRMRRLPDPDGAGGHQADTSTRSSC